MTPTMRDILLAVIVGVAFLLIALGLQLSMPTLAFLPVATFLIFLTARLVRRHRATSGRG